MSARWLLDVAALAQASRTVLQNHVALRGQQAGVLARTSSLASVTWDRARNVNFGAGETLREATKVDKPKTPTIPRAEDVPNGAARRVDPEGAQQDHHYDASQANSAVDKKPDETLEVQQKKGPTTPLPDGTLTVPIQEGSPSPKADLTPEAARLAQRQSEAQIPSQVAKDPTGRNPAEPDFEVSQDNEVFYDPPKATEPTLSSLPRVKLPKQGSTAQGGSEAVGVQSATPDVFYTPKSGDAINPKPGQTKITGNEDSGSSVSSAEYEQLFRTPRVASILQGNNADRPSPYKHGQPAPQQQQPWPPRDRFTSPVGTPDQEVQQLAEEISATHQQADFTHEASQAEDRLPFQMRESRVPSSRFGRIWQYAGLGASMTMGAAAEGLRRMTGSEAQPGASMMLSAANLERLVAKLSRMRGAALKLGQMLSFQDSKLLPPTIHQVLQRVQDSADYMPASQRNQVLTANLGDNWKDLFTSFDEQPMAAASIGQVHGAVMASTGERVVVKIQYPGVADSISSDLNNLSILLTASRLLPNGLYLDKTIANARTELAWECDYVREAGAAKKFSTLLADEPDTFVVPKIYDEASGQQVLTMARMEGTGITKIRNLTQAQKDWIGTQILRLCLREITEFRYMQTDPNWTNFLFNAETQKLELLDFGATRGFPDEFIGPYVEILRAASEGDRSVCKDKSVELGYLTGMESKAMLDAHISSIMTLAEPFASSSPDVYDFRDQTITDRVREFIPVMLRERLAPPPEETYSLHRKLSGAFLLLARLGSRVRCKDLFRDAMVKFEKR